MNAYKIQDIANGMKKYEEASSNIPYWPDRSDYVSVI